MDKSLSVRSAGAGPVGAARGELAAVRAVGPTALAAAKVVSAAAQTTTLRHDAPAPLQALAVVVDPQVREMLYRTADVRSALTPRQINEKAFQRFRAYARKRRSDQPPTQSSDHADLKA